VRTPGAMRVRWLRAAALAVDEEYDYLAKRNP
jgi:hypothetical protein